MNRHNFDIDEFDAEEHTPDTENRRFVKERADQPKRSPIRRKDKWRAAEEIKPKSKRNPKKLQHRLKYNWQGE